MINLNNQSILDIEKNDYQDIIRKALKSGNN